jgi:oligopeptidase B
VREPRPERRASVREFHGRTLSDPYDWLRDPDDPEVLKHLTAENAYTEAATAHLEPLRQRLFDEISARTEQTDMSVPDHIVDTAGRAWWVYARTAAGADHPTYHRAPAADQDSVPDMSRTVPGEELLLDLNRVAAAHEYTALGDFEISPDGTRLLWSVDTVGDELYTVHVRNLATMIDLESISETAGACWLGDDHVVWLEPDDALRPWRAWRHLVGADPDADSVLVSEPDERFWLGAGTSRDRNWLILSSVGKTTTQQWLLPLADPAGTPWIVCPRREGLDYDVEPAGDRLFVLHNANVADFEIAQAPLTPAEPTAWHTVVKGVPGQRILGVDAYAGWVVVHRRIDGVPRGLIYPRTATGDLGEPAPIGPTDDRVVVTPDDADAYDTDRIRIVTESYVMPAQVDELSLDTGSLRTLKRRHILPDPDGRAFRPQHYRQARTAAIAPDGVSVPISLVSAVTTVGPAPCLVYAYGAYETSLDPGFSVSRLSLLDRGVVVAYAHVRGGGEGGRGWYEAGRREHKDTTFTDLTACVAHLVAAGIADPDRIALRGFSAGGLTVGAALNLAPGLVAAAHVGVGFLDPLTDMLDPDLPLTITERDEWGDPLADPEVYERIAAYAPYGNVRAERYPAILATASLHDQRVSYAESAKWVAAIRDVSVRAPGRPVLLKTDLTSGHAGASGRYQGWRDEAYELAWLLDRLGAGQASTPGAPAA